MNDGSPLGVVLLLPARSAEPPQSSGSTLTSSLSTAPEARRVAVPLVSGGNEGSTDVQPSGRRRADSRSSSAARSGFCPRQAAKDSSQSACSFLPRSATLRACATASSSAGKFTSGLNPRMRLVLATSSAPSAAPWASPVFCASGAGQAMIVRSAMNDGWPVFALAAANASARAATSSW